MYQIWSNLVQKAEKAGRRAVKASDILVLFPDFVRVLGQMWYKKRKFFPVFVRVLGQIWYKVRKIVCCATRAESLSLKKAGKILQKP
ncbi:hypothetical protein gvb04_06095 [Gardnerella vaginalis]|nr:hypothetical protein gvb04_06095 [Gardnerella vaginalis]